VTLEEIADRLYALPPEDFTAARTAEAVAAKKADKDLAKQAAALRKPTVGAWLVNTLARAEPDLLDQLLALGPALADAQRSGHGDALRQLGEQRRQLIGAVTAQAFQAADREPTAAARAEVESTLEAALADPRSAEAVRSGRLVRAQSYAGFGEVDVTDAVAVPGTAAKATSKPRPKPKPKKDIAAAEQRALEAAGALDDAVRECEQAQRDHDEAEAARVAAEDEVRAAEQALHEARERRTEAEEAERKAARAAAKAEQAVRDAQAKAEKARTALDKLRRS
jgi:hypothetical protein